MSKAFSFILLGTSEFTIRCADALRKSGESVLALVTLPPADRPENSVDFVDYGSIHRIPILEYADLNSANVLEDLRALEPDFILSSWPYILHANFLQLPKYFVIGSHPTQLPIGRGRHPLHWMTVLNIQKTCLSFFKMDTGIDTGDLLLQVAFPLGDDILATNQLMGEAVTLAIPSLVEYLRGAKGELRREPIASLFSNYWRKRDRHDVAIDPRMPFDTVRRIVNSFLPPYSGARLYFSSRQWLTIVHVNKSSLESTSENWIYREHGYVFRQDNNRLFVKFDDCVVALYYESELPVDLTGKKLHPPAYYEHTT